MLLSFLICAGGALTAVGRMSLDQMVCCSDYVVVGRVVGLHEVALSSFSSEIAQRHGVVPPLVPSKLAELQVERWVKGSPQAERLVFLASSTWVCDITDATLGERGAYFLSKMPPLAGDEERSNYAKEFGARPLLGVVHSGRGRMELRAVESAEYATFWDEVRLPKDAPVIAGPEPAYEFIRSVRLDWLTQEVGRVVIAQRAPWLRVEVVSSDLPGQPWRLDVRLDRTATLVVGSGPEARALETIVPSDSMWVLESALSPPRRFAQLPAPSASGGATEHRTLVLLNGDEEERYEVGRLVPPASFLDGIEAFIGLWSELRGSFDAPGCIDHRERDAATLAAKAKR